MKMKSGFYAALFAGLVSLSANAVSASTLDFATDTYFTGGTNTYVSTDNAVSVEVDGVRVDRNGTIENTLNFLTASWAGENGGLGVYDCRRNNLCLDNAQIDGNGPNEFAILDFGNLTVEITSVTFAGWDSDDTFAFGVYESTAIPATAWLRQTELQGSASSLSTFNFESGQLVGSIIGLGVDSWHDNYLIQSITFEIVSAVPLPAGGVLFLTGLGGLVLMRRRRKQAA